MKRIKYTVYSGKPYLTDFAAADERFIKYEVDSTDYEGIKIGGKVFKMTHGVAQIPINEIGEGHLTPELVGSGGMMKLDPITVCRGCVQLSHSESLYVKLNRELLSVKQALDSLLPELKKIADAVFGKKLF